MDQHGTFKLVHNRLQEDDWSNIYDLIECYSRVFLKEARKDNEVMRSKLFTEAFFSSGKSEADLKKAFKSYIDMVFDHVAHECQLYQESQSEVLKAMKVHSDIWNGSLEDYLPAGEQYIRKALKFSMQSPFTFTLNMTEKKVLDIYSEGITFATDKVSSKDDSGFEKYLMTIIMEDADQNRMGQTEQEEKLILLDYLFIDYVKHKHDMDSSEIKSGISAYGIDLSDTFAEKTQNVVDALTK